MEYDGFAMQPNYDCQHLGDNLMLYDDFTKLIQNKLSNLDTFICQQCNSGLENLICMKCGQINCNRVFKQHALNHSQEIQHDVALNLQDLSLWCFQCDSTVTSIQTDTYVNFSREKKLIYQQQLQEHFEREQQKAQNQENFQAENQQFAQTQVQFTQQDLVEGLKNNKFQKILIMSGAGISVSAGIPDFRSPGTGIYEEVRREYKLENPEIIFTLEYFKEHPEIFYKYSKEFDTEKYNPTPTHNVDGLELKAGLSDEKLVQSHGSYSSSHCIKCNKEYSKEIMHEHLRQEKILRCSECNELVKPDVVLFGEKLPKKYLTNLSRCLECDLLLVIGTSLLVYPFASLKDLVPIKVPKILINKQELPGFGYSNQLSLIGSCDQVITQLCEDVGWGEELQKIIQSKGSALI